MKRAWQFVDRLPAAESETLSSQPAGTPALRFVSEKK